MEEVLPDTDVLYMTRIQKERFSSEEEYNKVRVQRWYRLLEGQIWGKKGFFKGLKDIVQDVLNTRFGFSSYDYIFLCLNDPCENTSNALNELLSQAFIVIVISSITMSEGVYQWSFFML